MGTWIKETDSAIYLMQGGTWIARALKKPSSTNPKEYVVDAEELLSWFTRSDFPTAMTVSVGTGAPEPAAANGSTTTPPVPPVTPAPGPGGGTGSGSGSNSEHKGMRLKVVSTTYFKLAPKMSSELTDAQKVVVNSGEIFDIEYYIDAGNNHWQIELLTPTIGDKKTTSWYVYTPDTALLTNMTLKVISDTLFKAEPKMSSQLTDAQKVFIKNGTQYKLLSSKPAAGDHVEVELADAVLGADKKTKWFVYQPDTKIEGQRQTLTVISDTLFKLRPELSSALSDSEKFFVKNGTTFLLNSYANPDKNHVKVALQGAFLGPKNLTTWYAYVPDIKISGTEIGNKPADNNSSSGGQPANPKDRGMALTFPGYSGTYYANDPILWTNQYNTRGNFTWAEALHVGQYDNGMHPKGYREPHKSAVIDGIVRVAKVMEDIRKMYGNKPIQVNSWYRDPAYNSAIGGASMSRHMEGDAVDFVVPGVSCFDVYARLDSWWGSKGGLASSSKFTHIDVRGYWSRWDYGY